MSEFNKDLCDKEHGMINEKIVRHEKWLGEHEKKIDCLEKSDATNTNEIKNLCQKIDNMTKALWGLACSIILTFIGLVVQNVFK